MAIAPPGDRELRNTGVRSREIGAPLLLLAHHAVLQRVHFVGERCGDSVAHVVGRSAVTLWKLASIGAIMVFHVAGPNHLGPGRLEP